MRRILVIHSTSDPGVEDRIARMAAKPELAAYQFQHIYFFLPEYAREAERDMRARPGEFLEENQASIRQRMTRQIEVTEPEMIVVHNGIAFTMAPMAVLNIIAELKERFPQMKFAMQDGPALAETLFANQIQQIFDLSPETQGIVKSMF